MVNQARRSLDILYHGIALFLCLFWKRKNGWSFCQYLKLSVAHAFFSLLFFGCPVEPARQRFLTCSLAVRPTLSKSVARSLSMDTRCLRRISNTSPLTSSKKISFFQTSLFVNISQCRYTHYLLVCCDFRDCVVSLASISRVISWWRSSCPDFLLSHSTHSLSEQKKWTVTRMAWVQVLILDYWKYSHFPWLILSHCSCFDSYNTIHTHACSLHPGYNTIHTCM